MQRSEVPLLRPRRAESDKGDVPSPGFPAVENGSDRWIQNRLKWNPYAPGQFLSKVECHPLHLTRRGVLYDVQGIAELEPDPKLARWSQSLALFRCGGGTDTRTARKQQSKYRGHQPMSGSHGVLLGSYVAL